MEIPHSESPRSEKNLDLYHFKHDGIDYVADTELFAVYCQSFLVEARKIHEYEDCYLMNRVEYTNFLLQGEKHRACFAYSYNTNDRVYIHPCVLIIQIDKASSHRVLKLTDEQDLGQFLGENQIFYREVCLVVLAVETQQRAV